MCCLLESERSWLLPAEEALWKWQAEICCWLNFSLRILPGVWSSLMVHSATLAGVDVSMRIPYSLGFLCLHQQHPSLLPFSALLICIRFVLLTVAHNAPDFSEHARELLWNQGNVYLQNVICHLLNVFWRRTLICNRNGDESVLKRFSPHTVECKWSWWLPTPWVMWENKADRHSKGVRELSPTFCNLILCFQVLLLVLSELAKMRIWIHFELGY